MFDLEEIKKQLSSGKSLEEVFENFDWKGFESNITEIFSANDFRTKQNFRFKTSSRFEIDVLAIRGQNIFCADCKEWSRGRHKVTALRYAVVKQENRTKELEKFLKKNEIAKKMLKIQTNAKFIPLVVTLYDESIIQHGSTFIVPSSKLNSFLLDFEKFL